MSSYEHREFMTSNSLKNSGFSEPLQKKIGLFDKMYIRLEDTVDEDREKLSERLMSLDAEIYEDMLGELENELQYNDVVEEAPAFVKGDTVEITGGDPKYIGVVCTVIEYRRPVSKDKMAIVILEAPQLPDGRALCSVDHVRETSKKPVPVSAEGKTDEEILEELWRLKMRKGLSWPLLEQCGIRADLRGWTIEIGQYILRRTNVFSYKYDLEKLK